MVTEEQVWEKLKMVPDPELGINLVDLGLIYEVKIIENQLALPLENETDEGVIVEILMTLTSPACPLASTFDELVGGAVREISEVKKVRIEITFDPPWSYEKMSESGKAELGWF